jgi:hypothetical protein
MHSDDIKSMADAIYREKVLRARRMPAEEKIFSAMEFYHTCLSWMAAGVRSEHPEATDLELCQLVQDRMRKAYRISDHRIFHDLEQNV